MSVTKPKVIMNPTGVTTKTRTRNSKRCFMKKCSACHKQRTARHFAKDKSRPDGLQSQCRYCKKERLVKWRKENAVICTKQEQKRWATPTERLRKQYNFRVWSLRVEYGLTEQEFYTIFESQNGLCPICNQALPPGLTAAVDHCHKTGKVRGLLHNRCNVAIGMLQDNPANAERAYKYLRL